MMFDEEQEMRGAKRIADTASDDDTGPSTRKYYRGGERDRIESLEGGSAREVRLLIASKSAGAVIGKSGANIKRLREEFKARVSVPDSSGPERVLSLETSSITLEALLEDICKSLMRDESNRASRNPSDVVDVRLLVHQSQAGCIIGRGGQKIKEFREQSGLKVMVYPECAPHSTDRVAQLVGDPDKVVRVLMDILSLFEAAPPKGPVSNYNPSNAEEGDADSYGGWTGGSGGPSGARSGPRRDGGGRGGRDRDGKRGGSPPHEGYPPPFGMPPYGMWGGAPWGGAGGNWGGFSGDGFGGFGGGPGFGGGSGSASGYGMMRGSGGDSGHGGSSSGGGSGGDVSDTQVSIPNALTGCIMGKGGERIKQIRRESGAEITISKEDGSSKDRIITIRGTREQIQLAQYLLQTCVKKYGSGKY